MSKRKTTEEFIVEAKNTHGVKYDYSKVYYNGAMKKVCIICPKHGEFFQKPIQHIRGSGCPECYQESKFSKVFGVGVTGMRCASRLRSYHIWLLMLRRCYEESSLKREPTYIGCSVCDDWLLFTNFKEWYDKHFVEGFHLDKDILVKGNKVYSPDTCCFVPQEINNLLTKRQRERGKFPIGVHKTSDKVFRIIISKEGKEERVGKFRSVSEAFNAYKAAKEAHIKYVAEKYKDTIEERVYDALINYKVEITD